MGSLGVGRVTADDDESAFESRVIFMVSSFFICSRVGQRGGGLTSSAARSEHEVSEIIDGISEHEVRAALLLLIKTHSHLNIYSE